VVAHTERPFHRGLDRAAVLKAALTLLDAEGRSGLTMRRIARELDVEAASLYTHVRNKDDLVDGVLDVIVDEVKLPPADLPWRPAVIAGLTHYRAALLAHPEAVPLLTERAGRSPSQFRLVERSISLLEGSGLSTSIAVQAHVALVAFTLGFVLQEVGRSPSVTPGLLESNPAIRRAISALAAVPVEARFRAGLDFILDGVEASRPTGRRRT
jgi:AcrR family transcriptional regulator